MIDTRKKKGLVKATIAATALRNAWRDCVLDEDAINIEINRFFRDFLCQAIPVPILERPTGHRRLQQLAT